MTQLLLTVEIPKASAAVEIRVKGDELYIHMTQILIGAYAIAPSLATVCITFGRPQVKMPDPPILMVGEWFELAVVAPQEGQAWFQVILPIM